MAKSKIDKMIEAWDPLLQKAFLTSIQNVRDIAQIEQIIKALESGNLFEAIKAVGLDPVHFRPLDKALAAAFEAGGNATSNTLPTIGRAGEFKTYFQFNIRNPTAERWISDYSSNLVTEIVDDQRKLIRNFLTKGLEAGKNPRTAALDLVGRIDVTGKRSGGHIGLTSTQSEWVQNYQDALASDSPIDALNYKLRDKRFDRMVIRADAAGEKLTSDQIQSMTNAYSNRALRYRAESISQSETMAALHEGQQQAMEQAIASGELKSNNVIGIWRTARDKRVRDSHAAMEGQEARLGEMFTTGDGNQLEFPGDPNGEASEIIRCRCWREFKIDFYAELV